MTEATRSWTDVVVAVAVATSASLLLLALLIRSPIRSPRRRLPPGPRGWPILGNLLSLAPMPHQSLQKLSEQYGPIMLLHLGSVRTLVITSPEMAEEVFKINDVVMASRPSLIAVEQFYGRPTVELGWAPYGQQWRNLRKICTVGLLTAARISQFREIREREVLDALHFILEESQRGNAVNMEKCFSTMTANNITQMMMKKSYCVHTSISKSDVPETASSWFNEAIHEVFILFGTFNVSDYVPLLKPFDLQGLQKRGKVLHEKLDSFFQNIVDERRQSLSAATPGTYKEETFLDALLGYGETTESPEQISVATIKALLLEFFAAGSDSSSVTSHWLLTELMRHPKVMRRVQEELDSVVGRHRLVQEDDLPKLTYLPAVINETFRLHPPGPLLGPHESTQDCDIQGFHIPAKTLVMANYWAIHRDPALWERPLEFDPDRFLDSKIDFRGTDFRFLPFGSGRRMCPGLNVGMIMILYPLALLLHALDWKTVEGEQPEELDISERFGIVLYKRIPLTLYGQLRLPKHVIYPDQLVNE